MGARMVDARPIIAATAAALLLAAAGCGGGSDEAVDETTDETTTATTTAPPTGVILQGSVGPGFDISLSADGVAVSTLAPGTYSLEVQDVSGIHNFHLTGPGVDVATGVGDEGTETFEVTLEPGSYDFVCDPHASSMSGSFEVSDG